MNGRSLKDLEYTAEEIPYHLSIDIDDNID